MEVRQVSGSQNLRTQDSIVLAITTTTGAVPIDIAAKAVDFPKNTLVLLTLKLNPESPHA
jgi:hypothetical protein